MAGFLSLPAELHLCILDFAGPSTHYPFALTCRSGWAVTRDLLRHHRRCYALYRVQSDILPLSILGLLRTAIRDPIAAWHIRDLELWGLRRTWADWIPHRLYEEGLSKYRTRARYHHKRDYTTCDFSNTGFKGRLYTASELCYFRELLRETIHLDEDSIVYWSNRIVNGDEQPIRMLLITMLPRLRSMTFLDSSTVHTYYLTHSPVQPIDDHSLALLNQTIRRLCDLQVPINHWPSGLQSLQVIAVYISTGLAQVHPLNTHSMARQSDVANTHATVIPLLALPSLKQLHVPVKLQNVTRRVATQPDRCWPCNGVTFVHTPVEKLCIGGLIEGLPSSQSEYHIIKKTLEYAPNLKSFHLGSDFLAGEDLFQMLAARHWKSLESLQIGCLPSRIMRFGDLRRFTNLKHVVLDVEWMRYAPTLEPQPEDSGRARQRTFEPYRVTPSQVTAKTLADILPASTVTVSLSASPALKPMQPQWEKIMDRLISLTIRTGSLPNLKAIFFGPLLHDIPGDHFGLLGHNLHWLESRAAAKLMNFELFGGGTHPFQYISQRLSELDVPRFVSAHDVMTDPRRDLPKWRKRSWDAAAASLLCRVIRMSKEM